MPFEATGELRLERGALRQRIEAEQVEQLPSQLRLLFRPILQRSNIVQALRRHFGSEPLQLVGSHFVT